MVMILVDGLVAILGYCALMPLYLAIYALGWITIHKNILLLKLQKLLGRGSKAKLGLVSRRNRITDVIQVSTEEEIDFQTNRSLAYVYRMTIWTPSEIVKMLQRRQKIDLMSDEQLAYVILSTVFAHSTCWDEERNMYRLKMEGFEDLYLFEGFYWDARHVLVSPDGKKIIIQMNDDQECHSDATDSVEKANYNLAKLHVQICLSYFAPGLSHNHVHFVFPSSMCLLSKQILDPSGILYQLLSPHFRFTERINYQALRVGKATNNKRSQFDRYFFLWQPFPVTKEQFMEGVARKCKHHYIDRGSDSCSSEEVLSNGHATNGYGPHHVEEKEPEVISGKRIHKLFPPDYVTDPKLSKIPYLAFLREYFLVVRNFVKVMEPMIDKSEWKALADAVTVHVPRFNEVDMVDAISTFIHQVGVVHFCDHSSYLQYFAYRFGCMAIRTPYESFKNDEHWDDVSRSTGLDTSAVMKDPLLLVRQRDIMRTRCFLNLFVDFIPNPDCNVQLIDTDYEFNNADAKQASADFLKRLRDLDEKLKKMTPPIEIPSVNERDQRADGLQVTELNKIVRTVCF